MMGVVATGSIVVVRRFLRVVIVHPKIIGDFIHLWGIRGLVGHGVVIQKGLTVPTVEGAVVTGLAHHVEN